MSSFRFVRKALLCCCMASGVSPAAFGQALYQTNGYSEYAIAGQLPGDQTRPALALSSSGGFLVWQDNGLNNSGLQIGGVALDSSFSRVGSVFRVNRSSNGDAERPQVGLFAGGGAVFVWQGGQASFQHIYARFLSATNSWLGNDVMVNSSTSTYQANAAVTVLSNGNCVVVWNSVNQYSP